MWGWVVVVYRYLVWESVVVPNKVQGVVMGGSVLHGNMVCIVQGLGMGGDLQGRVFTQVKSNGKKD